TACGTFAMMAALRFRTVRGFATDDSVVRAIGAGGVAGAVVGIAAAAVLLFLVVRYLIKFRLWVTEDRPGSAIRASANADAVHASACDDVGLPMGNVGTRPRESRGVLPL
ncbi:hypothetical protein LTR28_008903, partial [Elasticomyces elasticus]